MTGVVIKVSFCSTIHVLSTYKFEFPRCGNPKYTRAMNGEFISVGKALKLVPPFKGNKQEVLAFIGNVDTAFSVINSSQEDVLYRFVLTRISGEREPRLVIETLIAGQS